MKKAADILTITVFALLIAAPGFLTMTGTRLTEPLDENRRKAERPVLAGCTTLEEFDDCYLRFNRWFIDNYEPRDLLIRLKTQIDYSLFSTSDELHIGPSGWLFYRSTMDREKVAVERLDQSHFDRFLVELERLDRYLATRAIRLVVLPLPLKDVIYPEYLPDSTPRLPRNSRYQQLRKWLDEHDSIVSVDAYSLLTGLKQRMQVFHKTDFHWVDPAGYLYAQALVNELWRMESGGTEPLWRADVSMKTETLSGGQAKSLPLITTPRENTLVLGEQLPTEGRFDYAPEQPWEYTYDGTQEPRGKLGGAVVFSDSFFDALHRSGINTYFSSVHKARLYSAELEEIYRQIPDGTRYLIIEFIEPAMVAFMVNGFSVPEANEQAPVPAN